MAKKQHTPVNAVSKTAPEPVQHKGTVLSSASVSAKDNQILIARN